MENSAENPFTPAPPPKKTISKKKLLIIVGGALLLLVTIAATLFILHKLQIMHTVQNGLTGAASIMEEANGDNGYPQSLPEEATASKDVEISGGGSFDGTEYCITGVSNDDASIVYHISSGDKAPQGGSCPDVKKIAKPESVTNIEATIKSAGQLGFTWNSATGGVSYTLQCATDKGFTKALSSTMKASQTRTCNNLKSGTAYFVRVRANNASGAGPWSSTFKTSTSQLSTAPGKLILKPASPTSINYSWSPIAGAQGYVVEWASDINFTKGLKRVSLSATSGTASGLAPNTRYFFHVKAITPGFDAAHAAFSPLVYTSTPDSK